MDKFEPLKTAFFLDVLSAWVKQLPSLCLSPETKAYLRLGIETAIEELRIQEEK